MKRLSPLRYSVLLLAIVFSSAVNAEIKVGAPFPLTGSIAELAISMKQGAVLAAKHINEQGGVLNQPYTLVFEDDGCNPDKAVEVVSRLIKEVGVSAIIGSVCSGVTLRHTRSVSIPAGVVTLSAGSGSFLLTNLRDDDLVFRTAISDSFNGEALADYAIANGIEEVSISFATDAYNTSIATVFRKAFTAKGGTIVIDQTHQPDRLSYQREVSALLSGSKNLALFAYYGSSGIQLLKDVFATGEAQQILAADGMLAQEVIDKLGDEALKSMHVLNSTVDKDSQGFKAWHALAEEANVASTSLVANAYDVAFMMALAIQAAGSADRDGISAGLRAISGPEGEPIYPGEFAKAKTALAAGRKINYEGASGSVDFDKNGDVFGLVSINQVKNGKWDAQVLPQQ